jgi:hypothetical protein
MRFWRCRVETIHAPGPKLSFYFVADLNLAQKRDIYVDDSCRPLMDTFVKKKILLFSFAGQGLRNFSHKSSFTAGP